MFYSAECPPWVARSGTVSVPRRRKNASHSIGADKLNFDIASAAVTNPDFDSDVLQCLKIMGSQQITGHLHRARDAFARDVLASGITVEEIHSTIENLNRWQFDPSLRFH